MNRDLRLRARRALQDRYRIGDELGRGGMAIVYRAEDLRQPRRVAVKLLWPEVATHLGVQRFIREVSLAGGLVHPNIMPVLDTGEADGLPFYVMPLIENPPLRARIDAAGAIGIAEALEIAAQVADALAYAHARDVVHRDIKPENLLMRGNQVIVCDFGVGKALNVAGVSSLTQTGFIVGTPAYMSPEQAAGDPDLDARSDIFTLGAVLYEMISGHVPFSGKTVQQVIASRFVAPPPPLDQTRGDVPAGVVALVGRMMAVPPADRIATAAEAATLLRANIDRRA